MERTRKIVVVGHPASGRRTLVLAFQHKEFIENSYRSIFAIPIISVQINEKTVQLALYHTSGQEAYDHLRPLVYPDTSVVLICFNIDNPISAIYVIEKWAPEIRRYCDECPVILVGCKIDLRTDPKTLAELKKTDEKPLTNKIGRKLAAQINADIYMECSSKTGEGIEDLVNEIARLSLKKSFHHRPIACQCMIQ